MKKLKVAIVILIILPVSIGVSHIYLNSSSEKMVGMLSNVETSAREGDISSANMRLNKFMVVWEKNKPVYATFIRHAEIDLANQSAAKLKEYLADDEKSNFFAECETLKMQITHIADTERFSLDNIL